MSDPQGKRVGGEMERERGDGKGKKKEVDITVWYLRECGEKRLKEKVNPRT